MCKNKLDNIDITSIIIGVGMFILALPFIIWLSILLSQFPNNKIPCETTETAYILNGTNISCTLELIEDKIITIQEPCIQDSTLVDLNTNCNQNGIPLYSFNDIFRDGSEWDWYTSYITLICIACFLGIVPGICIIIIMICVKRFET